MARYCGFGSFGGLLGLRGSLRFEFRFLHGSAVRVRSFEEAQLQEEKKPFQKCRKHKWEQKTSPLIDLSDQKHAMILFISQQYSLCIRCIWEEPEAVNQPE